jgi:translation initiation factor 1
MMTHDSELVYSTDPSLNTRCGKCKKLVASCMCSKCNAPINASAIKPVIRLEKAHRNGKEVTIIDRLPASESFLAHIAQTLKKRYGCGGTYAIIHATGVVEIQGDKRDTIKKELTRLGITCG